MDIRKIKPILEIIIWNFIIYILFYIMNPNPLSFLEFNPSPLILGIVGFSLFYGNKYGLLNAFASIFLYSYIYGFQFEGWKETFYRFDYYKYPLLFLWLATSIGMVIDTHKRKNSALLSNLELLEAEYEKLKRSYRMSHKAVDELQEQIIDSDTSIISLYDISKKFKEINEDEIMTESIGVFSKYLKAKQVMIYFYQEDSSYLRFQIGVGIPAHFRGYSIDLSDEQIPESKYFKDVVENRKVYRFSEVLIEDFPIFVGPIIKNNQVIGLVTIRDMEFSNISNYAYTLFRIILDWVNDSIDRAKLFSDTQSHLIEGTNLMNFDKFIEKVNSEKRRELEYQMKHYLFAVKPMKDIYKEAMDIKKVIRTRDSISVYNGKIYLLLPATDVGLHPTVKDKIFSRVGWDLDLTDIDEVLL